MTTPEVSETASSELGRRIAPTFGYYRQPNGWITVSPTTRMEKMRYIEQGWQHLQQYGAFDMSPYVANHPFEALLMFGGAHEMPVSQLLETGLYLNPPMVPTCREQLTQFHRAHQAGCWRGAQPAVFPQMAEVEESLLGPFACDFCDRSLPTSAGREQHQSVAHKERMGDMQTGKSLGSSLAEALGNNSQEALLRRVLELEARLENQPMTAEPPTESVKVQCECGGSYKPTGKNFHERGGPHKKWLAKLALVVQE